MIINSSNGLRFQSSILEVPTHAVIPRIASRPICTSHVVGMKKNWSTQFLSNNEAREYTVIAGQLRSLTQ